MGRLSTSGGEKLDGDHEVGHGNDCRVLAIYVKGARWFGPGFCEFFGILLARDGLLAFCLDLLEVKFVLGAVWVLFFKLKINQQ